MKKSILILILLLISLAQAIEIPVYEKDSITVTNAYPEILVVYDEPIEILVVYILRNDNVQFDVDYLTSDNITFIMYADDYLINGNYELHILSQDTLRNPSEVVQPFIVDAPFMEISLESPHLGVSQTDVFDAVVKTGRNSTCKYSTFYVPPPQIDNFNFLFQIDAGLYHTIQGINTDNSFYLNDDSPDEDGKERTIYVKCVDENELVHPTSLYLAYDATPPSLGVFITPNPITDTQEPTAILQVSTSDRTICSYTENGQFHEFENYDSENFSAYKKEHILNLDFTNLARRSIPELFQEETVDFEITCMNLAGLMSEPAQATLRVAFEEEFSIKMNKPGSYTNDQSIDFEVETSIQTPGGCRYGENSPTTDFTTITGNKIYSTNLGELEEGDYSYKVSCIALTDREKTFEFEIDRTKPTNLAIDIKNPSCSLNKVSGTVSARDEESGIDRFNYTISKGGEVLTKDSTQGTISENIDLEEGESYRVSVIAYDKAGNFEEGEATFTASDDSAIVCDVTKPNTFISTMPTSEGVLVKAICLDSDSGCQQTFRYGLASDSDECVASQTHNLDDGILISEDTYLCWTVYDKNNNNESDTEFVEYETAEESYPAHCFNEVMDETETDIDCGGDCAVCEEEGSSCSINDDCSTKSCEPITNVCVASGCDNEYKDGYESDIDCGGDCSSCELGKNCVYDSDCASEICSYNICSEDLNEDTDEDGMFDSWEEKYNLNPNDPSDADEDPDFDGLSNLEEFLAGTDPHDKASKPSEEDKEITSQLLPPKKSSNFIPLTFIIIGSLLVIAGASFLLLEKKKQKEKHLEPRLIDEKGEIPVMEELSEEEKAKTIGEEEEKVFEKIADKKKMKRKDLMKEFQATAEKEIKAKELDEEAKKAAKKPSEKEEGEEKKKEGYVELSTLKKEEDLKEKDIGKDVFQELEMIKKEAEGVEEKERVEKEKEKKKETEEKTEEKEEELPLEIEGEEKKKEKKEAEEEELSQDDIFKKLAELAGQSHEEVKKTVDKKEVSSKDIMKVFANVTSKKQIDANVFKAILSQLLKRGQVSKQTIAEILFEFLDTELLTKKEVSDLIKDLELTAK